MHAPIRIIIADDHEIFRDGFKVLLRGLAEVRLVGEAINGKELIKLTEDFQVDVVITDIKMPEMDGITATKIIKTQFPEIKIITLSMFDDDASIVDMLEAGASGYVLKNTNKAELLEAIKTVYAGNTYYCTDTSKNLVRLLAQSKANERQLKQPPRFTARELQVIELICKELTNKEVANALSLSIRTVESYKENIQEKIGAKNVVGIAVYAMRNNLCFKNISSNS